MQSVRILFTVLSGINVSRTKTTAILQPGAAEDKNGPDATMRVTRRSLHLCSAHQYGKK